MDMIILDVTGIKKCSVGDDVVLIGKQGKEKITAEEAAVIGQYITDRIGKIVSDFEKQ